MSKGNRGNKEVRKPKKAVGPGAAVKGPATDAGAAPPGPGPRPPRAKP